MGQTLGCVTVKQSNVGIKDVFKKYEILSPGCHLFPWYFGNYVGATISMGFNHLNVPVQAKTKDNVFVTVGACIQYKLLEEIVVEAHHYQLCEDPATFMSDYVTSVIKGLVANMDLDSVFQQKSAIEATVRKELGKATPAFGFGFEIRRTFILNIKETDKETMIGGVTFRMEAKENVAVKDITSEVKDGLSLVQENAAAAASKDAVSHASQVIS